MANGNKAGSFNGEYTQYATPYIFWSYSQNIANNTTTVTATLKVKREKTGSSTNKSRTPWTIKIGRTTFSGTIKFDITSVSAGGYITIGSASNSYVHDDDGTKTAIAVTGTVDLSETTLGTGTASTSFTPEKIPRYATSNQSLNSKTSSSIKMNWSSNNTIDYIWYSKDNGSNWTGVDVTDGTSGTYTISGLSANTTYNIKTRVRRKDSQLTTDSSALAVTTYQTTVASISLSSKTSSSITVSSSCNVTASSTRYRIKTSSGSYGSWQTSATFSSLSANTTYVVQVEKVGQASGEYGYATVTVTTYQKTIASISASSKTVNSVTVTSSCNVTVSSTQYRIKTSSGSYGSYQSSATFTGLSPNTTYTIEVKYVGSASGESGTATVNMTTYAIATISTASNFNLGDSLAITYSNPGGNTVTTLQTCLSFTGAMDDIKYRDISKTGTSYTYNFTETELDTLFKKMNTANTLKVTLYIRTICNSKTYYNTKELTITLTGNIRTAKTNVSGTWKRGKTWININSTWKRAVIWTNVNGTWKRTN